jgi:hypothetical protein
MSLDIQRGHGWCAIPDHAHMQAVEIKTAHAQVQALAAAHLQSMLAVQAGQEFAGFFGLLGVDQGFDTHTRRVHRLSAGGTQKFQPQGGMHGRILGRFENSLKKLQII